MPLLGHEAGIEPDAEVLRQGGAAHLKMSHKRARGAGRLDEEALHPAPCSMKTDLSIEVNEGPFATVCREVGGRLAERILDDGC
jgi:hypothetical protein